MKLALTLFCLAFATHTIMADDYLHEATGIKLPATIEASKRGEISEYPSEVGKGYSIPFHAEGFEATIFIKKIEDDQNLTPSELATESIAAVKELESRGHYTGVKIYESDGKGDRPEWARAAFTARSDDAAFVSLTWVTIAKGHSVKIRVTSPLPVDRTIMKFAEETQKLIDASVRPDKAPSNPKP